VAEEEVEVEVEEEEKSGKEGEREGGWFCCCWAAAWRM